MGSLGESALKVQRMLEGEKALYGEGYRLIAGTDEAGRGPLAGPLFAAMVVFPPDYRNPAIDDSKKLSKRERDRLYGEIKAAALAYSIVRISPPEIDRLNVYEASRRGMLLAYDGIADCGIDFVITDCMPLPGFALPYIHPAKADTTYLSVAAASILAKVSRDREMEELDALYPGYGFMANKGYGTKEHLTALSEKGPIHGVHRFSFSPVIEALNKDLLLF